MVLVGISRMKKMKNVHLLTISLPQIGGEMLRWLHINPSKMGLDSLKLDYTSCQLAVYLSPSQCQIKASMPKKPKVAQGLPRQRQRPKASDQPVPVYKEALTDIWLNEILFPWIIVFQWDTFGKWTYHLSISTKPTLSSCNIAEYFASKIGG